MSWCCSCRSSDPYAIPLCSDCDSVTPLEELERCNCPSCNLCGSPTPPSAIDRFLTKLQDYRDLAMGIYCDDYSWSVVKSTLVFTLGLKIFFDVSAHLRCCMADAVKAVAKKSVS